MKLQVYQRGDSHIIQFLKPIDAHSRLDELEPAIREALNQGIRRIGIKFTANSYLYSKTISALVRCANVVHEHDGRLVLIAPGTKLLETLESLNLDRLIGFCAGEDELSGS